MGVMGNGDRQMYEANRRLDFVKWINGLLELDLPLEISELNLCELLLDGSVLRGILGKLGIDITEECLDHYGFSHKMENVERCLLSIDEAGLPIFNASDLERESTFSMVECLLYLRDHFNQDDPIRNGKRSPNGSNCSELDIKHVSHGHVSDLYLHHVQDKFCEVFQKKQGDYSDSFGKISELMKSNNFDHASTQSIINAVDKILGESIEKKNGEIPDRIAHSLRKAVQEIERQISTQVLHVGHLNNQIWTRENKYQSRIKVLETITTGTNNEIQITKDWLEQIKSEKLKIEDMKKEKEQDMLKLIEEKENHGIKIAELQKKIELNNESYEKKYLELEIKSQEAKLEMEDKLKNVEFHLSESQKKIKYLEAFSELQDHRWNKKEHGYRNFLGLMMQSLRDLRVVSDSIRNETTRTYKIWENECAVLGKKLKEITDASENYHTVLSENRKLYNEVQELKGNIRVYCRIRPFLPGQNGNATTVDYIGENGEIIITNPFKQGKDGHRMFKFNKVFSPTISQEDVFLDTQPLIRSVLDGFNVCIFAYGQTGSGKTYTMSGPSASSSKEDWGVNYRALNDLFHLKHKRRSTFLYEVGVQMIEIYNEQVRDLLSNESTPKRLGIWSISQPNGLTVPEASMHPVKSTPDVFDLMEIGETNRAIGTTALNERSSRSHSILTVHVRGMDLETGSTLRGCLHLVDLAGSERIYRSEAIGDRLKEAQHINKSLSALGDVIYALAQKSAHVPYRNSKLTQVLQSSLGGNAKTFMFVQINPDIESYSETISTLKFAERVSGVELGAARSNKEGNDVRGLMEQVMFLKDAVSRKDEEIERLQLLKDLRPQSSKLISKTLATKSPIRSMSPSIRLDLTAQKDRKLLGRTSSSHYDDCLKSNLVEEDNADVDPLGFGDGDSEEKLSDISYSHSLVCETDASMINSVDEYKLFPKVYKPLEDPNDKTLTKVPSCVPRPSLNKFGHQSLFRSKSKDTSSSSRKASTTQVSSTSLSRPSRRSVA